MSQHYDQYIWHIHVYQCIGSYPFMDKRLREDIHVYLQHLKEIRVSVKELMVCSVVILTALSSL